jgi:glycosyltransferase involved in cell wall biosynthesis
MRYITGFTPYIVNNLYAGNVRKLINREGFDTIPIKKIFTNPIIFLKCKIINFNWFENIENRKQYALRSLLLTFLNLSHIKIIYTLHNRQPHNCKDNTLSIKMMKKLCRVSDAIVGLCPDTEAIVRELLPESVEKLHIIPHPNYIDNYDAHSNDLRQKYGFCQDDLVFMFFGFVSPYKNVELLIDTFNKLNMKKTRLFIVGRASTEEYKEMLIKRINGNQRITCDFRYISDDDVVSYYNTANIIVLPYHKTSSLNSGAVYLSFSLGKTVICPDIGTINALKDKSFVYDYSYENEQEHQSKLEEVIKKIYCDYNSNQNKVDDAGKKAFEYVKREHSDSLIAGLYGDLYRKILK